MSDAIITPRDGELPSAVPLAMGPTEPGAREPTLDVLRGFAVLGILVVNINFMLGASGFPPQVGLGGGAGVAAGERIVTLLTVWLALGKFMPALALLFGAGAALVAERAALRDVDPQPLLRRRYRWLAAIGLAHAVLLFPGDVLFLYGVSGLLLIRSLHLSPRQLLTRGAVLLGVGVALNTALGAGLGWALTLPDVADFVAREEARVSAAYSKGTYLDIVRMHAVDVPGFVLMAPLMLPWTLGLFLAGAALARLGIVTAPAEHSATLRRAAAVGLGLGLPANLVIGLIAALSGEDPGIGGMLVVFGLNSATGPLLAMGYLAALALLCVHRGPIRPLADVGRMALTAYLFQSLVMLSLLAGARLYGRTGTGGALLIAAGTWSVLLAGCPVWLRRFRFGPAEWLWRSLSYRKRQRLRA